MANNYQVNYDDKRFTEVEDQKKAALNEVDVTYGNMISQADQYYDKQIQASKDWADKQTELQNQQTEFAIQKIEQEKAQAQKDYTKEQSGAYVDWQKQSNQYGANAEQMASMGFTGSGYSESSQVSMYNTYQNRVATARASFELAKQNYDNAMTEARLQNSSILAEIAAEAYQKQLELSLQGFQYKNSLIIEKANKRTEVENNYYNRYQDVLQQINTENALAEQVRQYNEKLALEKAQLAEEQRQFNAQMDEERRQYNEQLAIAKAKAAAGSVAGSVKKVGGVIKKVTSGAAGNKSSSNPAIKSIKKAASAAAGVAKTTANTVATMKSIMDLGYGPINAEKLDALVRGGLVEEYTSNGVTKFRKSPAALKQEKLFKG